MRTVEFHLQKQKESLRIQDLERKVNDHDEEIESLINIIDMQGKVINMLKENDDKQDRKKLKKRQRKDKNRYAKKKLDKRSREEEGFSC